MAYIGKQPTVGNFVKLDAIVTSATATYNLLNGGVAYSPQSANHCIVSLNGVIQEPTSASNVGGFTISGSTIVFTSALTATDVIDFILVLGDVLNIGTPSDATVGFAKVTSNLITGATAETSIAGGDSVLIYDDSASALRKMTRTNFVSGIGGVNTPIFLASNLNNQSLSHNTLTKAVMDTEIIDTASAYDPTTNYRFTVPSGQNGKYFIFANISLAGTNNREHRFEIEIQKNGTAVFWGLTGDDLTQGSTIALNLSGILSLVATDYVELFVKNIDYTASSTVNLLGQSVSERSSWGGYKLIE